jgi:hypothetical protein
MNAIPIQILPMYFDRIPANTDTSKGIGYTVASTQPSRKKSKHKFNPLEKPP